MKISGEMKFIYLHQVLRAFALSLISIFVPIYLLTLGFSINVVLLYFVIYYTFLLIFSPLALFFSKKIGYRNVMLFSGILLIIYLSILIYFVKIDSLIYLISIFAGIEGAFYWIPFHFLFTKISIDNKRGEQFTNYLSLGKFAGLISPFIGGIIATFFGFKVLFWFSIFFIIISIFPLFSLNNLKPTNEFSFSKIIPLFRKNKKFFTGTVAISFIGIAEDIIWPIFIFLGMKTLVSVGLVGTLVIAGSIIFTLIIGRTIDKEKNYNLLRLGGLLYAFTWIIRVCTTSPLLLYVTSLFAGFFSLMVIVSFSVFVYDKIRYSEDAGEFIVFREIPAFVGRMILLVFLFFFFNNFSAVFFMAAIVSLFFVFFTFRKTKK